MNSNLGTKVQQSLRGQLSEIQILIFVLNSATVSVAFIYSRTISQILGDKKDIDSDHNKLILLAWPKIDAGVLGHNC